MGNGNKQRELLLLGLLSLVLVNCQNMTGDGFECFRGPIPGKTCRTPKLRYYYDIAHDLCRTFMWGGCKDPNDSKSINRFETIEDCNKRCRKQRPQIRVMN
ncbi:serum basic protease inhibitor-like [Drosophila navojoa]|uniref:serum basic protease inhibitor-like n=1 Tax=Drosophila navojoa TaxID=7232 RepID=UPI0011BF9906|nr:serum basic protease inhibitor-like [Drosophila navojoa]